jgi:hypothetical protein
MLAGALPAALVAQEPRLVGRIPDATRVRVDSVLSAARNDGLPVEPLVDRALEGAAKGAPPDRIVVAVIRLRDELSAVRGVWGDQVSTAEYTAGASAIRAGAEPADLARLRRLRMNQPLTVAAAVLADLVAAGVPADTAVRAVLALAPAADGEYVAFRRNVQRDIELGASPSAALGVRLRAVMEDMAASPNPGTGVNAGERRKLKP